MFAWSGRASDAATIDAAVVGGTSAQQQRQRGREQRTPNSGGKKNREQRRNVLCVAFVLRPHLLSPTGVLSPPSDETANFTNSYILAQPYKRRTQPRTLYYSTQPYYTVQCFTTALKLLHRSTYISLFRQTLVCTRTKCRVFLRFLHKSIFLVLNNVHLYFLINCNWQGF